MKLSPVPVVLTTLRSLTTRTNYSSSCVLVLLVLILSCLINCRCCNAFGIVPFHLPSPEIVTIWTQQHLITTATSTMLPQLHTTATKLLLQLPHPQQHLSDLFAAYQNSLHTKPLQTQMSTGALLAIAGDLTAQYLAGTKQQQQQPPSTSTTITATVTKPTLDWKRTISFAAFDACYRAVQHILYPPLKNYFHGQLLYPTITALFPSIVSSNNMAALDQQLQHNHIYMLSAAAEQSLASQLIVIPLLYYPIFFVVTGMVQGLSLQQSIDRGLQSFVPLMQRNLLFWIPVQFGVFGFINDDAMQISILIACGFIWTMILSAFAGSVSTTTATTTTTTTTDPLATTSIIDEQLEVYMTPVLESGRDLPVVDTMTATTTAAIVPMVTNTPTIILPKMVYASVGVSNSTGVSVMMTQQDQIQQLR